MKKKTCVSRLRIETVFRYWTNETVVSCPTRRYCEIRGRFFLPTRAFEKQTIPRFRTRVYDGKPIRNVLHLGGREIPLRD